MAMQAEVVVVGAGVNGLATAWALAREGRDVLVLEQFPLGHTRGSSHGASRIFRLAYPEAHWVRLAQEALEGWRELEAETGTKLLELNGLIELVSDPSEGSAAALDECGVPWSLLDPGEAERRFPLRVPDGLQVVLQEDAGYVRADRALEAFSSDLRILPETQVLSLDPLDTTAGRIEAQAVVVTAGPWAKELLAGVVALPVVPTRETVAYFRLESEKPIPSVVDFKPESNLHGTYALAAPGIGLKIGRHKSGPPADPDEEGQPDLEVVEHVAEVVAERFPDADPEPVKVETCFYTNTDDDRFILERHDRIVVGSACSGHSFKFAPAVGRRLAALAVEALA
ncbi:MAG: FAD-dependent oxidoreductase [Actinomycetota bacterium]|nr:FAD-dependent oxidoreductase [Actinomycetota bacterium]